MELRSGLTIKSPFATNKEDPDRTIRFDRALHDIFASPLPPVPEKWKLEAVKVKPVDYTHHPPLLETSLSHEVQHPRFMPALYETSENLVEDHLETSVFSNQVSETDESELTFYSCADSVMESRIESEKFWTDDEDDDTQWRSVAETILTQNDDDSSSLNSSEDEISGLFKTTKSTPSPTLKEILDFSTNSDCELKSSCFAIEPPKCQMVNPVLDPKVKKQRLSSALAKIIRCEDEMKRDLREFCANMAKGGPADRFVIAPEVNLDDKSGVSCMLAADWSESDESEKLEEWLQTRKPLTFLEVAKLADHFCFRK